MRNPPPFFFSFCTFCLAAEMHATHMDFRLFHLHIQFFKSNLPNLW